MIDRGLPASLDAERAILGAILLDNQTYPQAAEILNAGDFSLDSHRRIYASMMELAESNRPIDFVTLTEQLGQHKELGSVGGAGYVTSLTDGLPRVKNIEQYVKIVSDKALLRQIIHVAESGMQNAYEQDAPAAEILEGFEESALAIGERRLGESLVATHDIIRGLGPIDAFLNRGQHITGLETHFSEFDNLTSGLQKSDLIVIAARPSMGKTAFAINVAENAGLKDQKVVGVFSLEMSREAILTRMLCSQAQVDSHALRNGYTNRSDRERLIAALSDLAEAPIFIDDTANISIPQMRAKCRRLKQSEKRLDLVIIDYLQLVQAPPGKRNRTEEVSAITRGLKGLAKELRCPILALSQLNRSPENRSDNRPLLADLRESGSIEQDADVVAFIFREEVYRPDDQDLAGKAELILGKQRNGPTGTVPLTFLKRCTRFENTSNAQMI